MGAVEDNPWTTAPYSALCRIQWGNGGTASGWLHSPGRLVTAGHVIADIGSGPFTITSAFGPIRPVATFAAHYAQTSAQPPAGGADDYGLITVAEVPPQCSFLNMVVPRADWGIPCFLLAFDALGALHFNAGTIARCSAARFLHTSQAWPGCSGGALVIRAAPVGTVAVGIHTDLGRPSSELRNDPGGGAAPAGYVYQVATALSMAVQQQIEEAST